jgi:hypothetical protein
MNCLQELFLLHTRLACWQYIHDAHDITLRSDGGGAADEHCTNNVYFITCMMFMRLSYAVMVAALRMSTVPTEELFHYIHDVHEITLRSDVVASG